VSSFYDVSLTQQSLRVITLPRLLRPFLITLGLFTLALIPRAVAQGTFITVDEAYHWFERADVFLRALQSGNYIETNQVGHPGVTTMWLDKRG
jgi:hypothetical protein